VKKDKKIAIFLGDWFWSSIPYDGIPLHNLLSEYFNISYNIKALWNDKPQLYILISGEKQKRERNE